MIKFFVLGMIFASGSILAQPKNVCDTLGSAVESGVKELAFYSASGALDDSAPRESNRLMRKLASASVIQSNLQLMAANKCAMPKLPISDTDYYSNALDCTLATSRAQRTGEKIELPECDRAKWVRTVK